jgi:hypothetical protein
MLRTFKNHVLLTVLVPLLVLTVAAAYYRAFVSHEYILTYEGECDAYEESCYVSCTDDACSEPFYYSLMTRSAAGITELCNTDNITECEAAYTCLPEEAGCEINFCDPSDESAECEVLEATDRPDTYSDPLDLNYVGT